MHIAVVNAYVRFSFSIFFFDVGGVDVHTIQENTHTLEFAKKLFYPSFSLSQVQMI